LSDRWEFGRIWYKAWNLNACERGGGAELVIAGRIIEELVSASEPSPIAKTVYAVSMLKRPSCIDALANGVGINSRYVVNHCRDLERMGWMHLAEDGRRLRPDVLVPPSVEAKLASDIRSLINIAPFKGESTTKFFVEWIVAPTVRLILHARPDFLRNPDTGQNLEYDIFAPDFSWATEYHGEQHFGPSTRYPGDKAFVERHKRDLRKIHLSKANRIRLSVVTYQTLTLEGILGVIPDDVPRRTFDPDGPVIQVLNQIGREIAGNQDWDWE
jgi:hypothetical protein